MRNAAGCLLQPILWVLFYGAVTLVAITLVFYPFLYVRDASSADAYRSAPLCGSSRQSNDCRAQVTAVVTNVRSFNGTPEFDLQINGTPVSVTLDSGSYQPRNGDSVEAEVWRGEPVRIVGPESTEMITAQYPDALLRSDGEVLGTFVIVGILSLVVAALSGWFGRRTLFARFQGMSRPQVLGGFLFVLVLIVITVPVLLAGQAAGWLPKGKAGGAVIGITVAIPLVAAVYVYRYVRRLRSRRG